MRLRPLLLLLALVAPVRSATAADAEDGVRLGNARCIDGRPIDPRLEPVVIRHGGHVYAIAIASRENGDALRKMAPVEALRAVVATNRELADRVALPERTPKRAHD